MTGKIYLALINKHFSQNWNNLAQDLQRCVPFPFKKLHVNLDLNLFYFEERNQYHSTLILSKLIEQLPDGGQKIVGLTHVDIFIPILTFLFGEAQFEGKGALVSTYRLRNEFYGLPGDEKLLYDRTLKEILHELGHTMGLVHCPDFECVMNASTYVEDIDLKLARYCKNCQNALGITCSE